jgi:hypothetical protein
LSQPQNVKAKSRHSNFITFIHFVEKIEIIISKLKKWRKISSKSHSLIHLAYARE